MLKRMTEVLLLSSSISSHSMENGVTVICKVMIGQQEGNDTMADTFMWTKATGGLPLSAIVPSNTMKYGGTTKDEVMGDWHVPSNHLPTVTACIASASIWKAARSGSPSSSIMPSHAMENDIAINDKVTGKQHVTSNLPLVSVGYNADANG